MTIKIDFLPGEYKIIQSLAKRQKKTVKSFIKERILSVENDVLMAAHQKLNNDIRRHLVEEAATLYEKA